MVGDDLLEVVVPVFEFAQLPQIAALKAAVSGAPVVERRLAMARRP